MNILIKGIEKKIEKKLKELNLRPGISPRGFLKIHKTGKHRYFSPCLRRDGELIAFYARLHDNLDAKEKFVREINFLKRLRKSDLKIKKIIPQILDYGIEKDFEWFEREYPKAPTLGYSRNLTQKPFPGMIEKITEAILEISKISPNNFPGLKKFNCQNYFGNGVYEDLIKKGLISREISEKFRRIIKKNFPLLEKENRYFCHGDMNLGNILSDKKNIWLIDWELIHLNNFAYDIGYLWAHLWEAKSSFRNELINSYLEKLNSQKFLKFKKLLPIVVSYLSLGGIELKKEGEKIRILEKRRRFYLNLLKNCLDFNKLIKI
jgi:serine/threonine protein kinase